MLKIVTVALVIAELVLLTTLTIAPAQATLSDSEFYTWSFAYPGSNQVVCKQIVMHPEKQIQSPSSERKVTKISSNSIVVSDSYCANLTKPYS
ncbi:MAG TPA: hypothetical protein DDZ80_28275 [Cyanobacteria bacterium UBA8803]|nr:hypothetical protein [Cyanobacteria bacterium UBA9273]HBL62158.1 hypothetical protein [Cyanobacteria bacterium UBA8803]